LFRLTSSHRSKQHVCVILEQSNGLALARFERANNLDCRISAYPPNVLENLSLVGKYLGITTATPTDIIIMIDLDKQNFKTDRAFNLALTRCLDHIKAKLGSTPSILWSGRGYHVIQPINGNNVVLEQVKEFDGISDISLKFLKIAESFLSLGKSDPVTTRKTIFIYFNTSFIKS
jgi:hypothetical protein